MFDLPTESDPVRIVHGDCLQVMKELPDGSVDAVITDPPYPCIKRAYGYWTEAEWFALMNPVVEECRRILKPTGSAVFVLQPNSERVGRMRTWLWRFMLEWGEKWGMVQDAWWWNPVVAPTIHCQRSRGLMRPSVKAAVWLGEPDCFRNQDEVLWTQSEANKAEKREDRALRRLPCGQSMRNGRCASVADERGGVTPFNLLPISNADSQSSAGAHGHGADTPLALCRWWTRYICPPGGTILEPFLGSGTVALAALKECRRCIGIERDAGYVEIARRRVAEALGTGLLSTLSGTH